MQLSDFLGSWRLTREIDDILTGTTSTLTGTTIIDGDEASAQYHETGTLLINGTELRTSRRYLWAQRGSMIDVRFEDGRDFHRFSTTNATDAAHFCDPDQYDVSYDFTNWPAWRSVWTVKGPRKDYVMTSWYDPASERALPKSV